jgi:hypothetical protein
MSSTSAASWNFATLARLEGGNASASSSLRGSITPVNSRPVTPEAIKVGTPIPPRVKSQHGSVHNSSISSTATMVDPGAFPPPAPAPQAAPLPTTMYGFHLPRPQAGRARTYSLTIAAEQAAQEQASLRSFMNQPATDYFVASHRASQSAVTSSHAERLAARRLKGRSSSASALDQFQQQHHKLNPPQSPLHSTSPVSTHSSRPSLSGSETRVVNSGFIVTRPRSGSSSALETPRPRSGSPSSSPVDPVLNRTSVGPSWHQKRMQRMVSSGSLDKLSAFESPVRRG